MNNERWTMDNLKQNKGLVLSAVGILFGWNYFDFRVTVGGWRLDAISILCYIVDSAL